MCVCVCVGSLESALKCTCKIEKERVREIESVKEVWRGAGGSSESFYANHAQRALNLPAAWAEI